MKSKDVIESTALKLDELSKVVCVASNSWDNELEFRLRARGQSKENYRLSYSLLFGLLFLINIGILVFTTTKHSDATVVRQQDLKMIREELLIPNTH